MLTLEEKVKIRHHLGYLNVAASQTFVLGSPAAIETQFIIEGAMNRVLPEAESEVRRHLAILDKLEEQSIQDQELLAVDRVDEILVRKTEMKEITEQYQYWRLSLGNLLGCYPNQFDKRFYGVAGLNVRVG